MQRDVHLPKQAGCRRACPARVAAWGGACRRPDRADVADACNGRRGPRLPMQEWHRAGDGPPGQWPRREGGQVTGENGVGIVREEIPGNLAESESLGESASSSGSVSVWRRRIPACLRHLSWMESGASGWSSQRVVYPAKRVCVHVAWKRSLDSRSNINGENYVQCVQYVQCAGDCTLITCR